MSDVVAKYDSAERQALANLPNRAIQAFGAVTFASVGYPFRVHDKRELWRYIDVMHEGRFERNLALLNKVSDEEIQLADWLANGTLSYSQTNFARSFTGRHCATRALFQLRGIQRTQVECPGKRVLELGPGSGYLSLLMAKTGYSVDTVEIAQAFALHQSQFFSYFLPDKSEVIHQQDKQSLRPMATSGIRQIPWWLYANNSQPMLNYDLITANHALAEFHPDSLGYLLRRFGERHTERFGRSPVIVAESLGLRVRRWEEVIQQFHEHGWTHESNGSFFFFRFQPDIARLQLKNDLLQRRTLYKFFSAVRRRTRFPSLKRPTRGLLKSHTATEHPSLINLRKIFDELVPDEMTPDETHLSGL